MRKPIPENQEFESFLSGCSVVPEQDGEGIVPLYDAKTGSYSSSPLPALSLKYPDTGLKLRSVLDKISQSLQSQGSPSNDRVAVAVLSLIVETRPHGINAIAHANLCLTRTHSARLMQSLAWPGRMRTGYEVRFATYSVAPFDPTKYLYWANHREDESACCAADCDRIV